MFHLAQANVARTVARFDKPAMAGMAARINEINAVAESSPGYVWRFKEPTTGLEWLQPFSDFFQPFEPERIFFNMSVWRTVEDLRRYVFESAHLELMRDKSLWLLLPKKPHLAMWWVPAGCVPSVEEARRRLGLLETEGPTAAAFTFSKIFEMPVAD
jgi:hypothetical protein